MMGENTQRRNYTHSSVGPRPSPYWISRESDLNFEIERCVNRPNLISLSMSTNSAYVEYLWAIPYQRTLTLVFLPKNLCEIECVFDRLVPHLPLECELHLRRSFGHRWKLKEITSDNDLSIFHKSGAKRGGWSVLGFPQMDPWSGGGCWRFSPTCQTNHRLPWKLGSVEWRKCFKSRSIHLRQ